MRDTRSSPHALSVRSLVRSLAVAAGLILAATRPGGADPRDSGAQRTVSEAPAGRPNLVKDTRTKVEPTTLGLMAGPPDLSEVAIAAELSQVVASGQETGPNGELALRLLPIVGQGGLQNVRDVLTLPGADMAIVPSVLLDRLRSTQELGDIGRKLAYVAPLYVQEFHVLAGPRIRSLRDLAGESVAVGAIGGNASVVRDLFDALGIQAQWVYLGPREALEKTRAGEIAATVLLSGKSVGALSRYKRGEELHFVGIDEGALVDKGYLPTWLTASDYPDLIDPGERISTVGVSSVLVAYNWPPGSRRHRLLADFVRLFFSRADEFQRETHHPKWREVNLGASLPNWPRFSAAEQWLQRRTRSNPSIASPGPAGRPTDATGSVSANQAKQEELIREFLRQRAREKAQE
jgi:TRAP-type uncharacterized transport system substrate-binding protein